MVVNYASLRTGKVLVSKAGYTGKVNVVKQTTSTVLQVLILIQYLIRQCFTVLITTLQNLSNPNGKERYYLLLDTFVKRTPLDRTEEFEITEGDILVFHNAGAYCFSMASNYNSRFRPAEILWYEEKHLIRERESFEDLIRL